MVKVSILFGRPADEQAFEEHFTRVHVPAGARVPGLKRIELGKFDTVFSTEAEERRLYRVVELWFEDEGALEQALSSPEAKVAIDDLPTFATGGVTVLTSEVEEVATAVVA
jgi:uncharacterized protein (TIGR02118 family)